MNGLLPWRGGTTLLDDMKREFDSMKRLFGNEGNGEVLTQIAWTPRVDVSETDKALLVRADIPGVDPKDVEVTASDGALVIRGHRKEEKKEDKENVHRVERFVGEFYRSIPLPDGVDAANITAQSAKGVVTITIPRKPGSQPKKIAVKSAE